MKKVITLMAAMLLAATTLTAKERIVKSDKEFSPNPQSISITSEETWDVLGTFTTQAAATQGVATDGNYIYTTMWNGAGTFEKYNMDGTFVEAFTIAGAAAIRDFAYDGEYFYGSASNTTLFKMDMETQTLVESTTISGVDGIRHLTYAPETDTFWGGNWTSLYEFDRSGTVIQSVSGVADGYGSAYDNWSAGGPYLWLFTQLNAGAVLQQLEIASGTFTGVTYDVRANTPGAAGDAIAGGAEATELYTPGKFAILCNMQQDPNLIVALELCDTAPQDAPGAPTNFTAVPGSMGALTADLDWTNPSVTTSGSALTDLTAVKVFRNGSEINSINNPVIGGAASYMDNAAAAGMNAYVVKTYNTAGEGLSASANIWCGPDAPGALEDLTLVQTTPGALSGTLTWTNPTAGAHGGYLAGIDGYTIVRNDGQEFYLDGEATTYVDATIPNAGNYSYTVVPENEAGEGTASVSNTVLIADANLLVMEGFDVFPPAGWSTVGGANWMTGASNNAGGVAPEAMFNWSPSTVGDQYMITPALDVTGASMINVTFKHNVNHYGAGYDLKLVYSSDMTNWTEIWATTPAASIPAEELTFTDLPVSSNTVYVAWLFSGDSFQINYWYVDDVMISKGGEPNPFDPPTNVVATVNGGNNVNLTWTAPNGGGGGATAIEEGFESGTFPPAGWTIIDNDGDNWNWEESTNWEGYTGLHCATSASYDNTAGALTPDNFLITPQITVEAGMQMSFWYAAQDALWAGENFSIFVSTTGTNVGDFTTELWNGMPSSATYVQQVVDLSAYAGQNIYLAIRHFNVSDMFWLNIDDVVVGTSKQVNAYNSKIVRNNVVSNVLKGSEPTFADKFERAHAQHIVTTPMTRDDVLYYKIYRNGTYLAQSSTTNYSDMGLDDGEYTYGVSAVYDGGESNQASSNTVVIGGGVWTPSWVEYGVLANYSYDDAVGVGTSPWKAAIEFDFAGVSMAYLSAIQIGMSNPEAGMTWKVTEMGTEPSDNVIGDLTGTFDANGDMTTGLNIMNHTTDMGGQNVAFVIESSGNFMALDVTTPTNQAGNWAEAGGWIHLDTAGFEGNWFLRAYVNNGVDVVEVLPGSTTLAQNYPNPFNPTTSINFYSNMTGKVELSVYNSNGELVSTLVNGNLNAGNHTVMFDASNLNSGVYFYTLTSPTKTITKKMVLVK